MKVLLTVHQFFPDFTAGTEVLTLGVARALRDRGHEVRVFTGYPQKSRIADSERFDRYEYDGIPVERFRHDRLAMGGQRSVVEMEYDNRLVAKRFRALLTEFQPAVVHFFHLQGLSASPIDECVTAGIPTVLTPTDFWFVCPTVKLLLPDGSDCDGPDSDSLNCVRHLVSLTQPVAVRMAVAATPDALLGVLVKAACAMRPVSAGAIGDLRALRGRHAFLSARLKKIDFILAPTRLIQRLLLRQGVTEQGVALCRYGVDLPGVARQRAASSSSLVIAFIGTLVEQKGAHVAIGAIRRLTAETNVRLDLYGKQESPVYRRQLEALAAGDARIRFLGTFPNEQMGDVLAGIDVLVVPSVWRENTPLVVYSAQAAACPVIGSDVAGIAEVIEHERNGLLFPAGDADALARAIARVANDRNLLARLSAAADTPKTTGEYVNEVERVYGNVLARRKAAV
jgi:glycosyltransferase involved in cell wall biosynthesis